MRKKTRPVRSIIGDYEAFFTKRNRRLRDLGIHIAGCEVSHIAFRTLTDNEYLDTRSKIERHCSSNIERVWNGRPMSIMTLTEPLELGEGFQVEVIELIPPVHQRVYKMGMEHVGVVIGDTVDEFSRTHRAVLTGQQFQSPECEPYYVTFFEDFTMVKFYADSLLRICEAQHGQPYVGFSHAEDWTWNQGFQN